MRFTNWDRFKDNKSICVELGCDKDDRYYCCPDLDGTLCKPKKELLVNIDIKEEDLDNNLVEIGLKTLQEKGIEIMSCKFNLAWRGECGEKTVRGELYCKKHLKIKCESCGGQATHECSHASSITCGFPLCYKKECQHNHK